MFSPAATVARKGKERKRLAVIFAHILLAKHTTEWPGETNSQKNSILFAMGRTKRVRTLADTETR